MDTRPLKHQNEPLNLKKDLGLAAATALVVGNTIGSGILMAPQSLAATSNPFATIIAWIITSVGSILLALSFAKLGSHFPETGGLIVGQSRLLAFTICSAILWILTFINVRGVKEAGVVSIITTMCKILSLIIFVVIAAMHFDISNFTTVSSNNNTGLSTLPIAVGITLWSFTGIESATIPTGEIKNPERNIKLSTIWGTIFTTIIYLAISILAIGAMPQNKLAISNAPLADIINASTSGSFGSVVIALGAIISIIGTLSGWILLTGRSAYAVANDKMFPEIFTKIHAKNSTPYIAIIISSIGTNILLITTYVNTLTSAFNFMVLLSTLSALPAYAFTAASEIMLLRKDSPKFNIFTFINNSILALLAFVYSVYAIYGTGAQVVMYGFILLLIGIPFYIFIKLKNRVIE